MWTGNIRQSPPATPIRPVVRGSTRGFVKPRPRPLRHQSPEEPKNMNPSKNPLGGSRNPILPSLGSTLKQLAPAGLSLLIILVLGFFALIYATCTQYIEPDQFAVKQVDV